MASRPSPLFRLAHGLFTFAHLAVALLFALCGLALIAFAGMQLWSGLAPGSVGVEVRLDEVLESLAVITVALAALELGQTILEEEVQRESQMSAPTRIRRFLSRFMVVLVVALSIESLVLVFRYSHDDPQYMLYAVLVGFAAAVLMIAWSIFVRLNIAAESLEPEGMQEAKAEDKKVK